MALFPVSKAVYKMQVNIFLAHLSRFSVRVRLLTKPYFSDILES